MAERKRDPSPAALEAIVVRIVARVSSVSGPSEKKHEILRDELEKVDPEWRPSVEALVSFSIQTGIAIGTAQAQAETARKKRTRIIVITAVVAIGALGLLMPRIIQLFGNDVVVPNSHFVGEHGKNQKLIVFVHGVIGDMDNTWVNRTTNASWPELMRSDPNFSKFDVFVYGYSSPAIREASGIGDIAKRFGQQLNDWKVFSNYQEIYFITHSMGGIITKRMLITLNTPSLFGSLQRVHCVIYMAVPSNGAPLAAVASWISLNPQFKSMSPDSAASFLDSVEDDWAALLRARTHTTPFPRTFSAYEKLTTHGFQAVPELYISRLSDGPVMPFDYNHINIVKPNNRESDIYGWVAARIREASSLSASNAGHEDETVDSNRKSSSPPLRRPKSKAANRH